MQDINLALGQSTAVTAPALAKPVEPDVAETLQELLA